MSDNLDNLRKIAEAATPGPWERDGVGVLGAREDWDGGKGPAQIMKAMMPWRTERMEANAEHVATFNPETVLALLSRVEKAERSCRLLGTIIERDGKNLVELTNSQDIIPEDGDGDWEVVWERAQEMKVRLEQAEARVKLLESGIVADLVITSVHSASAIGATVSGIADELLKLGYDGLTERLEQAEQAVQRVRDVIKGAPTVDPLRGFAGPPDDWPDDTHFTSYGEWIIANRVREALDGDGRE